MFPPVFALVKNDSAVQTALGTNPVRFWPFGDAKTPGPTAMVIAPYAVWQTIYGSPENYVSGRPDIDNWAVQIDIYANDVLQVRAAAEALRDALELSAYVTSWRGESWESATKRYRYSFDVEFWTPR